MGEIHGSQGQRRATNLWHVYVLHEVISSDDSCNKRATRTGKHG